MRQQLYVIGGVLLFPILLHAQTPPSPPTAAAPSGYLTSAQPLTDGPSRQSRRAIQRSMVRAACRILLLLGAAVTLTLGCASEDSAKPVEPKWGPPCPAEDSGTSGGSVEGGSSDASVMDDGRAGGQGIVGGQGPEAACDPLDRCRACAQANYEPDRGMTNFGCGLIDDLSCVYIAITPNCHGSPEYYDRACMCLVARCADVCPPPCGG